MHKEWRKIAKRERRRRIRTLAAKQEEQLYNDENFIKEQELIEKLMIEQIEKSNKEENEKWVLAERVSLIQWLKLQREKERMLQQHLEEEARRKLEWELEQQKKKIDEEKIKAAQEELKKKQEIFMENLDKFLSGDADEPPSELKVIRETRPSAELCPFFFKTACCRFGDQCSRNHQYPGISKVLLATNFYTHFGLSNANSNEYDTDIMLEYEDSETYTEFQDFFHDVIGEFEKFGKITQFKVCNNHEKHLRGNTYIEFSELRCAVAAYRALHTRWYGGRQLSLQFCLIKSWKNAICGLQIQRRCPKGRACNFLHVFRNPDNLFSVYTYEPNPDNDRSYRSSTRSWRWSESPEPDIPKRSSETDRKRKRSSKDDEHRSRRRHSPRRSERR
ncbi:U2 small nuclear ribonucleoprotein auxiliary factor 35 kDa subunit-related protein 2-like isoform X2 [Anticarsia gemmatalis]|uniref:U2 small nuclear ribonucleoprotein auxiliary factor 35 kDa subunit-related protein 2-like isoform X2 n=1 Tax=Anticarsia gemmatalis TaxID=129554 RepID=UPI003F7587C8